MVEGRNSGSYLVHKSSQRGCGLEGVKEDLVANKPRSLLLVERRSSFLVSARDRNCYQFC